MKMREASERRLFVEHFGISQLTILLYLCRRAANFLHKYNFLHSFSVAGARGLLSIQLALSSPNWFKRGAISAKLIYLPLLFGWLIEWRYAWDCRFFVSHHLLALSCWLSWRNEATISLWMKKITLIPKLMFVLAFLRSWSFDTQKSNDKISSINSLSRPTFGVSFLLSIIFLTNCWAAAVS